MIVKYLRPQLDVKESEHFPKALEVAACNYTLPLRASLGHLAKRAALLVHIPAWNCNV